MLVGIIIGSGIFRVPSAVAGEVGSVGGIALVWIIGGLLAVAGALCVTELSTTFPDPGGQYVYLREAWGRLPAFLFGWTRLVVLVPASLGAIALIFAAYLRAFLPFGEAAEKWIAVGAIAVVAALNYRSVILSARIENLFSVAKLLGLGLVGAACLILGDAAAGALGEPIGALPASWTGFGLALVTVMWTYSGWTSLSALAGEMRDPGRNLVRAMAWGLGSVLIVYLAINVAYLLVLRIDEMAASSLVASDAASRVFGERGAQLVAALVMLSTFGALQAAMMYNPRFFFAMARDGLLPGRFGDVHDRFETPHTAALLTAGLAIGYVLLRSFEQLAQAFILGAWPFHVLMVAGLIKLRKARPELERPYRTPGYPAVPVIFIVAAAAMLMNALFQQPGLTLFGFGMILAGVPVFYAIARAQRPV